MLSDIEKTGVYIDTQILQKLSIELSDTLNSITDQIFSVSGYEFNINSPHQIAVFLPLSCFRQILTSLLDLQ